MSNGPIPSGGGSLAVSVSVGSPASYRATRSSGSKITPMRLSKEAVLKQCSHHPEEVFLCGGRAHVDSETLLRERPGVEQVAPCSQDEKQQQLRSDVGGHEAGALSRSYRVDDLMKRLTEVPIDEIREPWAGCCSFTCQHARGCWICSHEADEPFGHREELISWRSVGGHVDDKPRVREQGIHRGAPQPLFRAEVMVHERLRDARVARDACRRRALVSELGEGTDRYRQDALAPILIHRRRHSLPSPRADRARNRPRVARVAFRGGRSSRAQPIGRHDTFAIGVQGRSTY